MDTSLTERMCSGKRMMTAIQPALSSAVSSPANLTEDMRLPSSFSTTDPRVLSLPSTKHTTHHHTPSYAQLLTQYSLHWPTSSPSIGLTSPHDTPFLHQHQLIPRGATRAQLRSSSPPSATPSDLYSSPCSCVKQSYCRLPRHNAALTAAAREQLVREMAEIETRQPRQSYPAPPPPYERALIRVVLRTEVIELFISSDAFSIFVVWCLSLTHWPCCSSYLYMSQCIAATPPNSCAEEIAISHHT